MGGTPRPPHLGLPLASPPGSISRLSVVPARDPSAGTYPAVVPDSPACAGGSWTRGTNALRAGEEALGGGGVGSRRILHGAGQWGDGETGKCRGFSSPSPSCAGCSGCAGCFGCSGCSGCTGCTGYSGCAGCAGCAARSARAAAGAPCRAGSPRTTMPAELFAPGAGSQDPSRVPQPHASCKATAVAGGRRCPPWDAAGAAAMGTADAL